MNKHLTVPAKRWWLRRWLCIHCGALAKRNIEGEPCTYYPSEIKHDSELCHPDAPCTCRCTFCQTFPGVKS